MSTKAQRIVTAAAGILVGSVTGTVGPVLGAAAADYALQQLEKKRGNKKSDSK